MRRLSYLVALSFLALLVAVPTAGAQGNQRTVAIQNFAFNPPDITVAPGTTATWTNNDSAPHTVTADDGSFDSETLQRGQSFSHTFQNPGTFAYHCEIHSRMMGSVTVAAGGGATTPAGRANTPAGGDAVPAGEATTLPTKALPKTGGPEPTSIFLIGGALVVGSGILVFGALLRRAS